jgi:hypothetical protein
VKEKEYIIFCDESEKEGKYYSNFYGGLLVGASQYESITKRLNAVKQELNLFGEVKWEKVTERKSKNPTSRLHKPLTHDVRIRASRVLRNYGANQKPH